MITALALVAYVVALSTIGSRLLARAEWPDRLPRLGILAWQALILNIVAGAMFALLAATVGTMDASMTLARLLHVCVMNMRAASVSPLGAIGLWFAVGALIAIAGRIGVVAARTSVHTLRTRMRARRAADLAGRADASLGATVIEHPLPFAFCVPGNSGRIIVTSAALCVLDDDQLAAVLAHERAHLRAHHHLVVGMVAALQRALPFVPAFRLATSAVARLVELDADDHAIRVAGRHALRGALTSLGRHEVAPPLLAASAVGVEGRLTRASTEDRVGALARTFVTSGVTLGFAAPVLITLAPAVVATLLGLCLTP